MAKENKETEEFEQKPLPGRFTWGEGDVEIKLPNQKEDKKK
jgi:hypothetical protein